MDSKEQIRQKRQTIRNNLKNTMIRTGQIISPHLANREEPDIEKNEKQQVTQKSQHQVGRMRRKTSLDIRVEGEGFDMFQCNEIYIYNEFESIYDLIRKIDEGAQSVVYQALEKKSGDKFAVKVFKNKDQDIIIRIKTHFRILKNLNHPNIIKAHNLFINEKIGISHLILQYSSSLNLRFYLLKNRYLKQTEVAEILSNLLSTIVYLHSNGVCHRDIKPQNILFNPQTREIKLIDFDISKMIKYSHQTLEMLTGTGTLHYKAPEMFSRGKYSQLVDIWSIGVICYQMIFGVLPFMNLYEGEVSRLIKETQPKYDNPNATELCLSFIKKCLEKDPLKRLTAVQALKSPFILKYSSVSSSASSPMRRKNSEDRLRNHFQIEVSKCYNEDSSLMNTQSLEMDNGIRLVVKVKENRKTD